MSRHTGGVLQQTRELLHKDDVYMLLFVLDHLLGKQLP